MIEKYEWDIESIACRRRKIKKEEDKTRKLERNNKKNKGWMKLLKKREGDVEEEKIRKEENKTIKERDNKKDRGNELIREKYEWYIQSMKGKIRKEKEEKLIKEKTQ